MRQLKADVTIIGAGITGLTIAYYLQKKGKKVCLIERNAHSGGVISSRQEHGFLYETGPNTGVLSNPELVQLFDDLSADCKLVTANPDSKKRWILKNVKWHSLPTGFFSAISTPLFSFGDKLRVLGEPFRKPGINPDESVADIVRRRLGKSFLDYAINPFISGIYAGNPEQLITRFALPKLYNLEQTYGSFIKGAIKKAKEPKSDLEKRATKEVFSAAGGLQSVINALVNSIGTENILLNSKDVRVNKSAELFSTSFLHEKNFLEINSKILITTVGGYVLPDLLDFIPKNDTLPISEMPYAKVIQVVAGYKKWTGKPLNAYGGLIPEKENRKALGILFPSSIFAGRAPDGGALLSVFMGGINKPEMFDMTDDNVKALVLNEINELLNLKSEPDMLRFFRYRHAIPQYDHTSENRLNAIVSIQNKYPGLILAGNVRDGIGIADRVKQAVTIAKEL